MPIFNVVPNNPALKGQLASTKLVFGEFNRYAVAAVHSRLDKLAWFVWDAETPDEDGNPDVIRIEDRFEDAVKGLID